jgi:hypothetical protein
MSVWMDSGFVTKHSFGCKTLIVILKECHRGLLHAETGGIFNLNLKLVHW